jgi:L-arabinose isomerase
MAKRAVAIARAAAAWRRFARTRALRIGPPFAGMGDFQVPAATLRERLGIEVHEIAPQALAENVEAVSEADIAAEMLVDAARFAVECPEEVHRCSLRVGLGLRRRLEEGGFHAFSLNFMAFDQSEGPVSTVPFLECCKAMARGIGYAGEGDVLTAALVGALHSVFGGTTFTEIFCPDWRGGALFLSHMGEVNPDVCSGRSRLYEKDYPFSPALNPAALAGAIRPGPATYVNIAPGPEGTFSLLAAPVEALGDGTHPDLREWVRAWVRPTLPLEDFLEQYSERGGTHHSALMLGDHREALAAFARMGGMEFHCIGS